MESKKNRSKRRVRAHHSSSASDSDAVSDIRKQIAKICMVSASDHPEQQFTRINNESKKSQPVQNGRLVRRQKNLNLYDNNFGEDTGSKSPTRNDFAEDCEIIADIRSTNAGLNYSNKKLERLWGMKTENSKHVPPLLDKKKTENQPSEPKNVPTQKKRSWKNVAVASLLERKQKKSQCSNESEPKNHTDDGDMEQKQKKSQCSNESEPKNHTDDGDMGACSNVPYFIRDFEDPDFYYRQTTVQNSDADFTVEHVGKVSVVRPRKYYIENFSDKDIAFSSRRRSDNTCSKQQKSSLG